MFSLKIIHDIMHWMLNIYKIKKKIVRISGDDQRGNWKLYPWHEINIL